MNCKYRRIVIILVCVVYLFSTMGIEIKAEASNIVPWIPNNSIGAPLVNANFIDVDLGGFLSHVYDSVLEGQSALYNGVYDGLQLLYNKVIDNDYCPGNDSTHLHSFVYGLTQRDGVSGYYCYCEYCGQFAGDLVNLEEYDNQKINNNGNERIYPTIGILPNVKTTSLGDLYTLGETGYSNSSKTFNDTPSGCYLYISDENHSYSGRVRRETSTSSYVCMLVFDSGVNRDDNSYIMNYPSTTTGINSYVMNSNGEWRLGTAGSNVSMVTNKVFSNKIYLIVDRTAFNKSDLAIAYGGDIFGNWPAPIITKNYYAYKEDVPISEVNDNYTLLDAPVSYIQNGDRYYGGTTSNMINFNNNTYYDVVNNKTYSFDSYEYDYSNRQLELNLGANSNDSLENDNKVTVTYGAENISIVQEDNSTGNIINEETYYYIALMNNPINTINAPDDPNVVLPTVSPEITNNPTESPSISPYPIPTGLVPSVQYVIQDSGGAYITTHEDIPSGLRGVRNVLADMFTQIPDAFGDMGEFMNEGFSFIPVDIRNMLVWGMAVIVIVGIFKLFWR